MCVITDPFDTRGARSVGTVTLQRMNDSRHHRGPDEGSLHIDPGFGFGHRRLPIVDITTGQQAETEEAMYEYSAQRLPSEGLPRSDAIVTAVAHKEFVGLGSQDLGKKLVKGGAFIDVKAAFSAGALELTGYKVWR